MNLDKQKKIPKTIHYCWFGGSVLPDSVKTCIESWKKYCPDYKIVQWDESNYNFNKNKYMSEAYKAKKYSFVSDYARLDIIYNYGGIYLDTDVELIRNWDTLLLHSCFMGREGKYVATGLGFGAIKNFEIIREIRDLYKNESFLNDDGSLNMKTTPMYVTEALKKYGLILKDQKQVLNDMIIYPSEYFCPKDLFSGDCHPSKKTYSIHHYDASWWGKKEKQEFEKEKRLKKNLWCWRIWNATKTIQNEGLRGLIRKIRNL